MSFSARKLSRPEGDLILIQTVVDAPSPEVIRPDGTCMLQNYLTMEQWNILLRADGSDVQKK